MATRAAAHQLGAKMLEQLLGAPAEIEREVPCPCGQRARFHQMRPKHLVTVLGPVNIERPYYLCPDCHKGHCPCDVELDTTGTEYSPGVRRMMAVVGSETSFEHGRRQLELLAGIDVTAKAVERQAELAATSRKRRSYGLPAPCNWNCRRFSAQPFPFCISKWTEPRFPWWH